MTRTHLPVLAVSACLLLLLIPQIVQAGTGSRPTVTAPVTCVGGRFSVSVTASDADGNDIDRITVVFRKHIGDSCSNSVEAMSTQFMEFDPKKGAPGNPATFSPSIGCTVGRAYSAEVTVSSCTGGDTTVTTSCCVCPLAALPALSDWAFLGTAAIVLMLGLVYARRIRLT